MEVDPYMAQSARGHGIEECRVEVVFEKTLVTIAKGICLNDIFGCSFISCVDREGLLGAIPVFQTLEQVR